MVSAVHNASPGNRASRKSDPFERRDEGIFFDHAFQRVDEIDHQMERRFVDERPADDAAPAQLDKSLDGLGGVHDDAGGGCFDVNTIVGHELGALATHLPFVDEFESEERLTRPTWSS